MTITNDRVRGAGQPVLLLGGGGHAAVVAETARAAGWTIVGYLDDDDRGAPAARKVGMEWLGRLDTLAAALRSMGPGTAIHAALGDPILRRELLDSGAHEAGEGPPDEATIVHPSAIVSPSAAIGPAVFIGPRVVINARARVERGAIVNTGAIVEHDCTLGAFCHVAPAAVLAGAVTVGENTLIGAAAAVLPGVRIGRDVALGAGAVATADIPDGCHAVGVPARALETPAPQDRG